MTYITYKFVKDDFYYGYGTEQLSWTYGIYRIKKDITSYSPDRYEVNLFSVIQIKAISIDSKLMRAMLL